MASGTRYMHATAVRGTVLAALLCGHAGPLRAEPPPVEKAPAPEHAFNWNIKKYDWETFGAEAMKNAPDAIKNGTDLEKAQYIYQCVGNELVRQGVYPNYGLLTRLGALATTGDALTGSCGYLTGVLGAAMKGAGFDPDNLCPVVGYRGLHDASVSNPDHGALVMYVDGKPYVFDLWSAGKEAETFGGAGKSPWNGMPLDDWIQAMEKEGYKKFNFDATDKYHDPATARKHLEEARRKEAERKKKTAEAREKADRMRQEQTPPTPLPLPAPGGGAQGQGGAGGSPQVPTLKSFR